MAPSYSAKLTETCTPGQDTPALFAGKMRLLLLGIKKLGKQLLLYRAVLPGAPMAQVLVLAVQ